VLEELEQTDPWLSLSDGGSAADRSSTGLAMGVRNPLRSAVRLAAAAENQAWGENEHHKKFHLQS